MSDSLFADRASRVSRVALDGLSLRQQAISRNLSNVDTPGYRAQVVDFKETLARLSQGDGKLSMTLTSAGHQAAPGDPAPLFALSARPGGSFRADQNNVDIDTELADMSEVGIQYQAVSQAVSQKLLLLKTLAK